MNTDAWACKFQITIKVNLIFWVYITQKYFTPIELFAGQWFIWCTATTNF